jgi:hypothetical protein
VLHYQGLWSALLIGDDTGIKGASFLVFVCPISMAVLSGWLFGAASTSHASTSNGEIHNNLAGNSRSSV